MASNGWQFYIWNKENKVHIYNYAFEQIAKYLRPKRFAFTILQRLKGAHGTFTTMDQSAPAE
jgi:hypothetical protein